ncbi:MAG TPA: contractile injection system protein, VgrG/Pvc8 family [Caulobacteraceae bacterium]|nr:contractile injection system protein, VgrG/Pvc8 family [Caulobacteraceae bacterium]
MSSAYTLSVGGQIYGGWTSIKYRKSLDAMARSFEIEVTDKAPGAPANWPLQTGLAIKIMADGVLRLTGWVDEVEIDEEQDEHKLTVRGRGRTGDLIDCSAMNSPGSWRNRTALQIIADLCKPFGISVTATTDVGAAFATFALQQGEAVKDAIDRIVQQRGLLPIETDTGDLVLARPGQTRAGGGLTLGQNCKGKAKHAAQGRFSTYVVKGTRRGTDQDNGKTVSQVTGKASDPGVTRYRPLMILAEEQATGLSATQRAQFAATVRAGRAQSGELTTFGDRDASGAFWEPNTIIPVNAADLGLQDDLLASEIAVTVDGEGESAVITVVRPEAYSLGEVKGSSLSRLDKAGAGRGARARKGRTGGSNPAALGSLE